MKGEERRKFGHVKEARRKVGVGGSVGTGPDKASVSSKESRQH